MAIFPAVDLEGATLEKIEDNMKYKYTKYVESQCKTHRPLRNRLDEGPAKVQGGTNGKQIVMALKHGLPTGHGFRGEGGALPSADYTKIKNGLLNLAYDYGTVQATGQVEEFANGGDGSFVDQLATDLEDLKDSIADRENRYLHGDGSGALSVVTDVTNKAANPPNIVVSDVSHLAEGMLVDIYTTVTKRADSVKIVSVDEDTNVVTFRASDDLSTVLVDDVVYFEDSKGLVIDGLQSFVGIGSYAGIDGASYSWWRSTVMPNPDGAGTPRTLTRKLLRQGFRQSYNKVTKWPTVLVSNDAVQDTYADSEMNDGRWALPTKTIELGYEAVHYRGRPWICDEDSAANSLYFLHEKNLKFHVNKPWSFLQSGNSIFRIAVSNGGYLDAKQATMKKYYNLGCDNRRAQTVLQDLSED